MSLQEIQKQVESQSSQRINNIRDIQKLLRHSEVQEQVSGLVDLQKIEVAVACLDNETLDDLASQSRFANDQLQAGIGTGGIIAIVVVESLYKAMDAIETVTAATRYYRIPKCIRMDNSPEFAAKNWLCRPTRRK